MTEEERKKYYKYLKENAKLAYDFLVSRAKDAFKEDWAFEDFREHFVTAFGFSRDNVSTTLFLHCFNGLINDREYFHELVWDEIRADGIKFTQPLL